MRKSDLLFTIPSRIVCLEKEDLYMDTQKIKKTFDEFYDAFNEFMDWVGEEDANTGIDGTPIPQDVAIWELTDKEEITKAFKEHRSNFSVPILVWDILHMSWINKTAFWYEGALITPIYTGDIFSSGFLVKSFDGCRITMPLFSDYIDEDNVCCKWEKIVESIIEDIDYFNRYSKEMPF